MVVKGRFDGQVIAIKIPINSVTKKDAQNELETMSRLRHRNVLGLLGVVNGNHLLFEFMEHGSLLDYVAAHTSVPNDLALGFVHDIACGMCYLHEMELVHRDLAARNVLLDDRMRAKVADFGLSRFLDVDNTYYYKVQEGKPLPVRWLPNESLPSQGNPGKFSSASDVWSFGVTVWEIWSRKAPYSELPNNTDVMAKIESGENPLSQSQDKLSNCPPPLLELLKAIFQVDPKKRPKFDKLKVKISDIVESVNAAAQDQPRPSCQVSWLKPPFPISPEHKALIDKMKEKKDLKTEKVEQILTWVDRSNYCPQNSFVDRPQGIGHGINISAPSMHAVMLELVAGKLDPGGSGLDIGSGSGFVTACMGWLVGRTGKVIGIDHEPKIVEASIQNIQKDSPILLLTDVVQLLVADGRTGYVKECPYDVIHIGAVIPEITDEILAQLKPGGRLVASVGPPIPGSQKLKVVDEVSGGVGGRRFETKIILNVIFQSLTSKS